MVEDLNLNVIEIKKTIYNVPNKDGNIIATLKPINLIDESEIDFIVNALTKWRNKSMSFFKTGFIGTNERTLNWLKQTVIENDKKIFFLVYVGNKMIGHFGLCNITPDSAELDNAIRGEKGGQFDLFTYIENTIIDLAFNELQITQISGNLFSSNFIAMSLHKQFGFFETKRSPIKLVRTGDEWEYVECSKEEATTKVEYVEILLLNGNFKKIKTN